MLKEALGTLASKLAPQPSKELARFNYDVLNGHEPRIPVYDKAHEIDIQCYGKEKERMRLPWGDFEKSYFITRSPDGEISVFFEGFFPRK